MKKALRISILLLSALLLCNGAYGQDTRAQESKKARLEKEIAQLDKQLAENRSKSSSALSSLTLVQKKIEARKELIAESDKDIKELATQISARQKDIDKIQKRLDTLQTYYARLVKNAYKNRDAKVWYMYILASDNLSQAFRRVGYLRGLSSKMNTQAERISATKAELEEENAKLQVKKDEAQKLRSARVKEMNSLKKEESQARNLVGELKKQQKKYQKELASKKKQVEDLNREIERLIRQAGKSSSKGGKAKDADIKLDKEFSQNKGKLPWPAQGPVVEKFGQHSHPVFKSVKMPFNNGITIALDKGSQIKAVFDGVVKQRVVMPGYKKCILVQHGSNFTFYCKMGTVAVKAGEKVKTGQVLGTVDTIGDETRLHFQIWKETKPQNPEAWLR